MWRSVRLVTKTVRFEAAFIVTASVIVATASLLCAAWLEGYGLASSCVGAWLAGTPDAACTATVEGWAGLSSDGAGRLLLASGLVPLAAGLAAGVVLVGRELESGTAELSWSLAHSRTRWLVRRLSVLGLLVVVLSSAVAVASNSLENAHTAGGLWISPFADADLFGLPVVARSVLAFGVGSAAGALIGRTLPAFLVGVVIILAAVTAMSVAQPAFARLPTTGIGGPGYIATYLADPDVEFRFVTRDARLLTKDEALALVPAGTEAADWLQSNMQLLPLGISGSKTFSWQLLTSGVYASLGVIGLTIGVVVGLRRRPLVV
jgi:hypothetical protein